MTSGKISLFLAEPLPVQYIQQVQHIFTIFADAMQNPPTLPAALTRNARIRKRIV